MTLSMKYLSKSLTTNVLQNPRCIVFYKIVFDHLFKFFISKGVMKLLHFGT